MSAYKQVHQDEEWPLSSNTIPRNSVNIAPAPTPSPSGVSSSPLPPLIGQRHSVNMPRRSDSLRSEFDTITLQRGKFKQLVEALATSVRLLEDGMGSGSRPRDPELGVVHDNESIIDEVEEYSDAFLNVQKLTTERMQHEDEILEGVFKTGYGPVFFDEYRKNHDLEPFEERSRSMLSTACLLRRFKLRRELWEMLLGQVTRQQRLTPTQQRSIPESYQESTLYNKIALFVEVLSSRMGLDRVSENESEAEFDYRLHVLVTICRTNGLYIERDCRLNNGDAGVCDIQMIFPEKDCEIWSTMRVGGILSALYAEDLLQEPALTDLPGHRLNAARVLESLYPLRFFLSEFDWKEHFHSRNICPKARHPHEILNMQVKDLIQLCRKNNPSRLVKAGGVQFSMKLVNIKQLQIIGNINIEWTDNLYEHLELSLKDFPVLKLYWFAWATLDIPLARIGTISRSSREELLSTYHVIFGVSPQGFLRDQRNRALKRYNRLETHPRLQHRYPFMPGKEMTGKNLTKRGRPYDFGADYHLPTEETHVASFAAANMGQDLYERYPVFGDRLRILVAYMDSQKPGGLRGLWYDKRDSGAWFTFWAVLWIGGISLLIALLSLGVSILQAVAAMQALNTNPFGNETMILEVNGTRTPVKIGRG